MSPSRRRATARCAALLPAYPACGLACTPLVRLGGRARCLAAGPPGSRRRAIGAVRGLASRIPLVRHGAPPPRAHLSCLMARPPPPRTPHLPRRTAPLRTPKIDFGSTFSFGFVFLANLRLPDLLFFGNLLAVVQQPVLGWWNWQTRQLEVLVGFPIAGSSPASSTILRPDGLPFGFLFLCFSEQSI